MINTQFQKDENGKIDERAPKEIYLFIKHGGVVGMNANGKQRLSKHLERRELEILCSYLAPKNEIILHVCEFS